MTQLRGKVCSQRNMGRRHGRQHLKMHTSFTGEELSNGLVMKMAGFSKEKVEEASVALAVMVNLDATPQWAVTIESSRTFAITALRAKVSVIIYRGQEGCRPLPTNNNGSEPHSCPRHARRFQEPEAFGLKEELRKSGFVFLPELVVGKKDVFLCVV